MLIENKRGDRLLELARCDEGELAALAPLTHALVVARSAGRNLLVCFSGATKLLLQPSKFNPSERIEYGALYVADVERIEPFIANDEISDVCWWDGGELTLELDAIDRKLIQLV